MGEIIAGENKLFVDGVIAQLWSAVQRECQWLEPPRLNQLYSGKITWPAGRRPLHLEQHLVVPEHLNGYPLAGLSLRLALVWWAEAAEVFVDGRLAQSGDLFDAQPRILLRTAVKPGEQIHLQLKLISPSHDQGALIRSHLIYQKPPPDHFDDPGIIASQLEVLNHLCPDQQATLAEITRHLDLSVLNNPPAWAATVGQWYTNLEATGLKPGVKKNRIYLLGHAHLDLAWLWPVPETWLAAERTFSSVINLHRDFPELIFSHSTPALYQWLEQHRPQLFQQIQAGVQAGWWEAAGGMWVEPDLNLIGPEAIVRQLLYGQLYLEAKFGTVNEIAWLPDTFGFCATLPQFLAGAGIRYFVTQKLLWNDTSQFPHPVFWWRSPDGSQVLALMSGPIGEGFDPTKIAQHLAAWQNQTNYPEYLWLIGVGDHGGGPTRDMLETTRRWQAEQLAFPEISSATALGYLQKLAAESKQFPTWQGELYLQFHRGCYTSHADQKRHNRTCESLLYQAELWATIATLTTGQSYPKLELQQAWQRVMFNQFHDILPGTAITEVFTEANQNWQRAIATAQAVIRQAWQSLAVYLPEPPRPNAQALVVDNCLNWPRSQVIQLECSGQDLQVLDSQGQIIPSQASNGKLYFWAENVPSIGYAAFWLCSIDPAAPVTTGTQSGLSLTNEFLEVSIDRTTGNLDGVFDRINQWSVLSDPGNQLLFWQDQGQYWDAWNIDPDYQQYPLEPPELVEIIPWDFGSLRQSIRVTRRFRNSTFWQDYILERGCPYLKIATRVDWQERGVLVKASFPLGMAAETVSYEIPGGAIARPTNNPEQWEVPALKWADYSDGHHGVGLLNDCKHGYSVRGQQLQLTLLRSPSWPDPFCDLGQHEFTYALYPHMGNWQQAATVKRGYELQMPLTCQRLQPSQGRGHSRHSWLELNSEQLVITALKQSEKSDQQWILRCYEWLGRPTTLDLSNQLGLKLQSRVDLLERPLPEEPENISAHSIVSFGLGI